MSPVINPNKGNGQPAEKKITHLEAETISPTLLSGLKATAVARLTCEDEPLRDKEIRFYYPGTHELIGTGMTDDHGVAHVATGTQVGGILSHVLTDFAGAYTAEFQGNSTYMSSTAQGDVNLMFNIIGK